MSLVTGHIVKVEEENTYAAGWVYLELCFRREDLTAEQVKLLRERSALTIDAPEPPPRDEWAGVEAL